MDVEHYRRFWNPYLAFSSKKSLCKPLAQPGVHPGPRLNRRSYETKDRPDRTVFFMPTQL